MKTSFNEPERRLPARLEIIQFHERAVLEAGAPTTVHGLNASLKNVEASRASQNVQRSKLGELDVESWTLDVGRFLGRFCTLTLLFAVLSPAQSATNVAVSTSYRTSASAAGNSYAPLIAADGNRVIFLSHAPNLATNEDLGPHLNLFTREVYAPSTTALLSFSTNGRGANASVTGYFISSIGTVVFETAASNLTRNDTNGATDVFLRDFGNVTKLVSVNAAGTAPGNGRSYNAIVSRYGERVVFVSEASDLVPNDTNGVADVFVRDNFSGKTSLVSFNAARSGPGNGPSFSPSIPDYGQHVAFVSRATDLVPGVTNTLGEVYVRDLINTNSPTRWAMAGLTPYSPPCLRQPCPGWPADYVPSDPVTFDGGSAVVFKLGSHAIVRWSFLTTPGTTNDRVHYVAAAPGETLVPGPLLAGYDSSLVGYVVGRTNAAGQITNSWLRRINFNIPFETVIPPQPAPAPGVTSIVYAAQNVVSGPPVDRQVYAPSMSSDGARFVFASDSTRLVAGITNGSTQIYFHDMGAPYSTLVSARPNGTPGPDLNGVAPSVTRNGRTIVWDSPDPALVTDDLNGASDVFLRDYLQGPGQPVLFSARHANLPAATGYGASRLGPGGLSGHGRVVGFTALDTSFVANDTNRLKDAFVLNLATGVRSRLTSAGPGLEVFPPALDASGRFAVFEQATIARTNLYRADLLSNTLVLVAQSPNGNPAAVGSPSMSGDGRFVAFHSGDPSAVFLLGGFADANSASDVFVRDFAGQNFFLASVNTTHIASGNAESRAPVISPDGRWVAYLSRATDLTSDNNPGQRFQLFAYDQTRGTVKLLSYTPNVANSNVTALPFAVTNPVFSADARFVFFTVNSNVASGGLSNSAIVRHDLANDPLITITNFLIGGLPVIRTNLTRLTNEFLCGNCANPAVSADGRFVAYEAAGAGGTTNIVVHDLQTGTSEFISLYGNVPGTAHHPLISLDGRYVVFTTKQTGPFLDTNNASDVFVRDRRQGFTHIVSRSLRRAGPLSGPPPDTGNRVSSDPVMSFDGRTIAFHSFASDLVAGDYNDTRDVFVLSLSSGDVDRDGMDDDWELAYFNTLSEAGNGDFDQDGADNLSEFRAGTDPTNEGSVFQVLVLTVATAPDTATVLWSAVPGRTYRIQRKSAVDAAWTDVPEDVLAFAPGASKTFQTLLPASQGFFRAVLVP